jgi:hypothetical protein
MVTTGVTICIESGNVDTVRKGVFVVISSQYNDSLQIYGNGWFYTSQLLGK